MKKLILSVMLCFGVGFTLMGSPAQVSDDNNPQTTSEKVSSVSLKKIGAISGPRVGAIARECGEVKKEFTQNEINPSKHPAHMMRTRGDQPKDGSNASPLDSQLNLIFIRNTHGIIKEPPVGRPGGAHTNGLTPLPGGRDLSTYIKNPFESVD